MAKKETKKSNGKWYILNTYSGHEKKVANLIELRVKANDLEDQVEEVVVPTQDKIVVNQGKKRTVEEKIFPGYVLIKMVINDQTWRIVRNTEGVTGFVGTSKKPTPLSETEVEGIMNFMDVKQAAYQPSFSVGDAVKVLDGPFKDFVGSISEINEDKGQVKVLLSIFGRETPIVLDFLQVSRL
jgi:transcriptional antiterminator NusG